MVLPPCSWAGVVAVDLAPIKIDDDEVPDFVRYREGGTQGLKACEVVPLYDCELSGKGPFAVGPLFPILA